MVDKPHMPRETFKQIMGNMRSAFDYDMEMTYQFASEGNSVETYVLTMISDMCLLISELFNLDESEESLLEYYCFELNFGRDDEATHVTTINVDGFEDFVDLSDFDKLYDYLISLGK